MSALLWCRSCRQPIEPGEALAVQPVDGSPGYAVHRPSLSWECFHVGPIGRVRICLFDERAARSWDKTHEPEGGPRANFARRPHIDPRHLERVPR